MTRRILTDDIWLQIQETMQFYDCYRSKNIMEAIRWKLRTNPTWRDIPEDLCPWQTVYNRFNLWAIKGLWDKFFLKLRCQMTIHSSPQYLIVGLFFSTWLFCCRKGFNIPIF